MRKLFLLSLTLFVSIAINAKDVVVPKFVCFVLNDQNVCEKTFDFTTNLPANTSLNIVRNTVNGGDFISRITDESETGFKFEGVLQTENRYNPFAGSFKASLSMKGVVTYANGHVIINLTSFYIDQSYAGYGINSNRYDVTTIINDIISLQNTVATSSGKAKKEANKQLEDKVDIVSESDTELYKRMSQIQTQLSR